MRLAQGSGKLAVLQAVFLQAPPTDDHLSPCGLPAGVKLIPVKWSGGDATTAAERDDRTMREQIQIQQA